MNEADLGRCYKEFDFVKNTCELNDTKRTAIALKGMEGKRLTYASLVNSPPKVAVIPKQYEKIRKRHFD